MKHRLFIAALLTCVCVYHSAFCQTGGDSYYSKGVAELNDTGWQQALSDFNQAITADKKNKPSQAKDYQCRAMAEIKLKDYKDAINDCSTALSLDNTLYVAYSCKGEAEVKNEDYRLAIEDEKAAVEYLKNDNVNLCKAYLNLAEAEIGTNDYSDAVEHCNAITAIDSTFKEAYFVRVAANKATKNYDKVILDCNKAIPYYKNNVQDLATLYYFRATAESNTSDYKKAVADDSMAIIYNPKYSSAYWNRGYNREKANEFKTSVTDYMTSLPYFKDDKQKLSELYFNIGRVQSELNNSKEAIDAYDSILTLLPHSREAFWFRGTAYKKCEQYDLAIADYNKAIFYYDVDPESCSKLYNSKAMCEEKLKHYADGIKDDSIALVKNPKNGYAYWTMGYCYEELQQYKAAINNATTAMQYFATDSGSLKMLYINRGNEYTDSGNYKQGISDINYAITLEPKYPKSYWALAYAYEDSGAFDQAIAMYTKTLSFYSSDYVNAASLYKDIGFNEGRLKQYQKAVDNETKAISLDSTDAGYAYFERGRNYLLMNNKPRALSDFKKSMRLDTSGATYAFDIFFCGDTAGAVKILKRVLATAAAEHKNLHADNYNLSCFMSLMNKPGEALSYLKKAIDEGQSKKFAFYDPDFENIRSNPEFGKLVE